MLDQAILNELPQAVLIARASDYRVVLSNPAACPLFGLDHLEGSSISDLQREVLDGELRPLLMAHHPLVRAAVDRAELRDVAMRIVRHDSRGVDLLVNARPLYSRAGEVVGTLGVFQDVSRLR